MAFNLGSITFGLAANTAGLSAATRELEAFGAKVSTTMAAAKRGVETNINDLQRQERAAVTALQNVQNATARINQMKISPEIRTEGIQQLERATSDFIRMMSNARNGGVDSLAFQRAQLGLKEATDAVTRSLQAEANAAKAAGDAGAAAMRRQEIATIQAEHQVERMIDAINRAQRAGNIGPAQAARLTGQANAALVEHTVNTTDPLDSVGMARASATFRSALSNINRDLDEARQKTNVAAQGFRALSSAAMLSLGPLSGISFRLHALNTMVQDHGVLLGGAAAAVIGFTTAIIGMGQQMIRTTIQFQQAQTTLQAVFNSAATGNQEFEVLRRVADQTGVSFMQLAPSFSRFVASANATGQGLRTTNNEFRQMALIAGTLHLTNEEVNRMMIAFDQMFSAGRAQGQELRQLINVMPATYHAAAQAAQEMGTNLRDALRHGSLEANEFIQRFLRIQSEMLHIDATQPLHTLQSEFGRLQNRVDDFRLGLINALNSTPAFIQALQAIQQIVASATLNINGILQAIAAFSGALAGLAIGGALAAVISGFVALVPNIIRFNQALALGVPLVRSMAVALGIMGVAEGAAMGNIAGLVGGIVTLVATLTGAVIAEQAMSRALEGNASAMAEASQGPVEQYIQAQRRMLTATADTTEAMVRQQAVLEMTARMALEEAQRTRSHAAAELQAANAARGASGAVARGDPTNPYAQMGPGIFAGQSAQAQRQYDQATTALNESQANYNRMHTNLLELQRIWMQQMNMPEPQGHGYPGSTRQGRHPPDPQRGLRALNDLIQRATMAQTIMDHLWEGPTSTGLIDAIQQAQDRLFNMEADQRAALTQILQTAGYNVQALGGLSNAVSVVAAQTRLATEQTRRFNAVWRDIDEARGRLEGLNEQLAYLRGGGNPDRMWWVEGLNDARETLRALTGGGEDSIEAMQRALQALQNQGSLSANAASAILDAFRGDRTSGLQQLVTLLDSLNVQFEHTGDAATDALNGMTAWNRHLGAIAASAQAAQRAMSQLQDTTRDYQDTQRLLNGVPGAAGVNGGGTAAMLEWIDHLNSARRALQALRDAGDTATLDAINSMLERQGFIVGSVDERYASFTIQLDRNREAIDAYRETLRQNQQAWVDWGTSSLQAFQNWATGSGKFMDAVRSTLRQLAMTILNTTLFQPLQNQWTAFVRNFTQHRTPGTLSGNPLDAGSMGGIIGIGGGLIPGFPGMGNSFNPLIGGQFGTPRDAGWGGMLNPMNWFGGGSRGMQLPDVLDDAAVNMQQFTQYVDDAGGALGQDLVGSVGKSITKALIEGAAKTNETTATLGATGSLTALTTAAGSATAALSALATASAAGGATGTAGLIGSAFSGVTSMMGFGGVPIPLEMLGLFDSGGPVTGGQPVRVGGKNGLEVFVPGESGRMLSSNDLKGLGGGNTHIDASSTFVIQGNVNEDVFKQMQAWAWQREMRLRQDLPVLIDSRVLDSSLRNRL